MRGTAGGCAEMRARIIGRVGAAADSRTAGCPHRCRSIRPAPIGSHVRESPRSIRMWHAAGGSGRCVDPRCVVRCTFRPSDEASRLEGARWIGAAGVEQQRGVMRARSCRVAADGIRYGLPGTTISNRSSPATWQSLDSRRIEAPRRMRRRGARESLMFRTVARSWGRSRERATIAESRSCRIRSTRASRQISRAAAPP